MALAQLPKFFLKYHLILPSSLIDTSVDFHLYIAPIPTEQVAELKAAGVNNLDKHHKEIAQTTRDKLTKFFAKYNKMLAAYMKDDRFLWKDTL